jgi:hypothetical protein
MSNLQKFAIEIDRDLANKLTKAASEHGLSPESLIAECVSQHLEIALRHRVLIDRMESVDEHIATLAQFVGEATQDSAGLDLTKICRYRSEGKVAK